ncbi:short-chain dehydrogenase [Streptomyces sp. MUSC 14]|uniref:SDR family oxidoreductase n=1 Tax=Streptomyces sp. MUSC 14 TaxID=1354889 RepID=UPI0008F5E553|nr:SDR family oxidoreductase [Streptomyces sp. MUSC 14]OIJ86064.1 short-chain dehydrogenase [Streptomyces sp. MUSC 14]
MFQRSGHGSQSPRVVVVTGASGGVGRAAARAFAARGDRVALVARGRTGLDAAADEIRRAGGTALPLEADVADPRAVENVAARVERELGPIDVWVNDAFTTVFAEFTDIEPDEFRRVTEVCYLGYVYGTQAALRRMLPRDHGVVVQVGSALAYRGIPLQSAYCGAKHAIQGWNEAVRCELLHRRSGVSVTMVQLPALNTPQFDWSLSRMPYRPQPVPPIYQPELAARAVVHAAGRPRRREYWVGASTVGTLLANAVAPGLLDHYLARTGYDSQMTDEPKPPGSRDNLWQPLDGIDGRDFGAHGRFGERAASRAPQPWASRHHDALALAGVAAATAAAGLAVRHRPRRR